jgi:hypothetical protein
VVKFGRRFTAHRGALAEIAVELTNSGLDYYFIQPLKVAKAGFIVEQSAGLGMTGVQQLMGSVIRNVIGRMDGPQLLACGLQGDVSTCQVERLMRELCMN